MSGTSADGLTITLVNNKPFRTLRTKTYKYPAKLQQKILTARDFNASQISELSFELGKQYANSVKKFLKETKKDIKDIFVVGSHGQTITHNPCAKTPNTLQIGEPAFMSAMGLKVVYNFRVKDMVLGGQGAPLVPFFDQYIFGKSEPKILLNIGGIANLSVTGKGVKTFGFDTGPGNSLMDTVMQSAAHKSFDRNGAVAAKGKANEKIIKKILKHKYFSKAPPKSLDKGDFENNFLNKYFGTVNKNNLHDVMATLNILTARTITLAVRRFVLNKTAAKEIVVSGGGALNKTLLENISLLLPELKVHVSDFYGIDPMAKESAAFALMATLALQEKTNHCPEATGAKQKTILGSICL
ncbi:Putative chaperone [Elusimicrobium minutum Pei191]|uniref:Putative chaperone n=2 Tax=Elusimicrobium TaxID=423604 RepID=B2KEY1_ELUMP|nr:Putative chaperone [Elusimicrobium minutum Pei191]